jgi:serine/threonine-protein kinase HipA
MATPDVSEQLGWLAERELAAVIDQLRRSLPTLDANGPKRALIELQGRLPVVVSGARVGLPSEQTPATHLLKASVAGLDDVVANEAYCLALARALGLPTASARRGSALGRDYLLVEQGGLGAGPRASFCEALGVPRGRSAEADGGPSAADCFALLRTAVPTPARDILTLVDAFAFNFLVGNHEAGAASFALLHAPGGTRLAPLDELVCTAIYPQLSRKLALRIGGKRRPRSVRRRQLERFAEAAGLGPAAVRRRIAQLAARAPRVALQVRDDLAARGERAPVLGRVSTIVSERSEQLSTELAAPRRPAA